jgi:hypothetical protein
MERRTTSTTELDEIINYWSGLPRGSDYHIEGSLIYFLSIFSPEQIKGAMYLAKASPRLAYFKYLCGILHKWRRELEEGHEPVWFDVSENKKKKGAR